MFMTKMKTITNRAKETGSTSTVGLKELAWLGVISVFSGIIAIIIFVLFPGYLVDLFIPVCIVVFPALGIGLFSILLYMNR